MKIKFILSLMIFTCILAINVWSQEDKTPSIDEYIDTGKTIVIAKCLSVEPVMRSGSVHIEVQILRVLKGEETKREITVTTTFQNMDVGTVYLLRTENAQKADENYFRIKSIDSMIALPTYVNIDGLKNLSLKDTVSRIMNSRKMYLDNQIRRLTDERKRLEQIMKESDRE